MTLERCRDRLWSDMSTTTTRSGLGYVLLLAFRPPSYDMARFPFEQMMNSASLTRTIDMDDFKTWKYLSGKPRSKVWTSSN